MRKRIKEILGKGIKGGIFLFVFLSSCASVTPPPQSSSQVFSESNFHVVKKGETLYRISLSYGVPVEELRRVNKLKTNEIFPGQRLIIPRRKGVYHRVEKGQTLWRISRAYGVSLEEIRRVNRLNSYEIKAGDILFIPGAEKPKEVEPAPELVRGEVSMKRRPKIELIWPVKGEVVRYFDRDRGGTFSGIEIAAEEGTPVLAAAEGEVTYSGWLKGYGRTIIIKHKEGFYTCYLRNSVNLVKKNDRVEKGEEVARVGRGEGGRTSLYFEVRRVEESPEKRIMVYPVNPLDYLP